LAIYLTIAVVLTILGALPEAFEYRAGHWVILAMTPDRAARIWDVGVDHTLSLLLVVLLFAAADLGALALGEDTKRRELDFLLTRPRPRHYFIWTSWLAGLTELVPLLVLPILTSILVLFTLTRAMLAGRLLQQCVPLFAMAAALYTLVFLLATATGSAQNGFQFAALIIILYNGFNYARNEAWFYRDYRPKYYGAFDWYQSSHQLFPYVSLVLLVCATLMLPLLAQAAFKRRDL
jgi:ABC-type transport system involved in multi-copper enzyme maturation permease subunit